MTRTAPLISKEQMARNQIANARINEVASAMITGVFNVTKVMEIVQRAGFKCDYAMIHRDMQTVRDTWKKQREENIESARAVHEAQLWDIYNAQILDKQYSDARQTMESIRRMNGTDEAAKTKNQTELTTGLSQDTAVKLARALYPDVK